MCGIYEDSVTHFLLLCDKTVNIRSGFLSKLKTFLPTYSTFSNPKLVLLFLNIDIGKLKDKSKTDDFISTIISFVKNLYLSRARLTYCFYYDLLRGPCKSVVGMKGIFCVNVHFLSSVYS